LTSEDELEKELDRTAKLILLTGPLTAYSAQKILQEAKVRRGEVIEPGRKDPPASTVHGHFRILEESGEITVYPKEKTGRREKYYGVTLYGFLWNLTRRLVETKFATILRLWLGEEHFNFFLPGKEVLNAIEDHKTAVSLGRFCLAISDGLPHAEDLMDFLAMLGYDEADPATTTRVMMEIAFGIGFSKNPTEIIAAGRVLCDRLPSFRKHMVQYVEDQRDGLVKLEQEFGLIREGDRKR
jgi:hypothetical protein